MPKSQNDRFKLALQRRQERKLIADVASSPVIWGSLVSGANRPPPRVVVSFIVFWVRLQRKQFSSFRSGLVWRRLNRVSAPSELIRQFSSRNEMLQGL